MVLVSPTIIADNDAVMGEKLLVQDGLYIAEIAIFVCINKDDIECASKVGNAVILQVSYATYYMS